MALVSSLNCINYHKPFFAPENPNLKFIPSQLSLFIHSSNSSLSTARYAVRGRRRRYCSVNNSSEPDSDESGDEINSVGVDVALSMLRFYKREISPLLPNSCRYVPTCSEYSMIAYKKYGVVKGTILTAYRLCRCNPLGGSGFDPPRWFDEPTPPQQ